MKPKPPLPSLSTTLSEEKATLVAKIEQVEKSTLVAEKALNKGLKDIENALKHIRDKG